MKSEIIKQSNSKWILKCGTQEVELTQEEYEKTDLLLQDMQRGNVGRDAKIFLKRTGEWVSFNNFQYLIRKKSSEPKIWGEDIQL